MHGSSATHEATRDGNVSLRRVADDSELLRLPAPAPRSPAGHLAFSPDGRFLAASHVPPDGRQPRHRLWDLTGGGLVLDLAADRPCARLAFSPDGRRMAAGRPDHVMSVYDLATCREVNRLERVPELTRIAFHPLGRLLAISSTVESRGRSPRRGDRSDRGETAAPEEGVWPGLEWGRRHAGGRV